jgi:sugar/nucleoside kinase (ribokinase family)
MEMDYDVIVAGSYSIDLIFTGMSEPPQLGKDILSTGFTVTPGEAFISAVSLHRLGVKVGWAADFGNDEYSQLALQYAREEGLDESMFIFHDRPYRRISVAASYPQERGFITYYDPDPQIPAAVKALSSSTAKVFYIPALFFGPLFDLGIKLVHIKKMKLVMDGNSSHGDLLGGSKESLSIRKALQAIDIFLPNAQEARRLTGTSKLEEAARFLCELCPLVVIKDGSNGAYACTKDSIIHMHSIPVKPVDTTGAGDNFNAGFLTAWLCGESLDRCLQWGVITGGLSTTQPGGTTVKIDPDIVKDGLRKYFQSKDLHSTLTSEG